MSLRSVIPLGILFAVFGDAAGAQQRPEPAAGPAATQVTVRGVVWDSITAVPLRGATIQLISDDDSTRLSRSAVSDSMGRFAFAAVPSGRYIIGFLHPLLDSIGIEAPVHSVTLGDARTAQVDLGIPSPARIRQAACGSSATGATGLGGLVLGFVRDARDGAPLADVPVRGHWFEMTIRNGAVSEGLAGDATRTFESGWFALCGVPTRGLVTLSAGPPGETALAVEVEVPSNGFVRRDLYVGEEGEGLRVTGVVTAVATGQHIRDVEVTVAGRSTRTDGSGEWSLADIPAGSRMLEARALGFYPARRIIDVVGGAAPVHVELFTMRAMLDTIRVRATVVGENLRAFETRRRALGMGRFLTRDDIMRMNAAQASLIFRVIPGLSVYESAGNENMAPGGQIGRDAGGRRITMRTGELDQCMPYFYVDGIALDTVDANMIDLLTDPQEIAGIEVYFDPHVPPQFSKGRDQRCGSVVIWRMPPPMTVSTVSRRRRLTTLGVFAGGAVLAASAIRMFAR